MEVPIETHVDVEYEKIIEIPMEQIIE